MHYFKKLQWNKLTIYTSLVITLESPRMVSYFVESNNFRFSSTCDMTLSTLFVHKCQHWLLSHTNNDYCQTEWWKLMDVIVERFFFNKNALMVAFRLVRENHMKHVVIVFIVFTLYTNNRSSVRMDHVEISHEIHRKAWTILYKNWK